MFQSINLCFLNYPLFDKASYIIYDTNFTEKDIPIPSSNSILRAPNGLVAARLITVIETYQAKKLNVPLNILQFINKTILHFSSYDTQQYLSDCKKYFPEYTHYFTEAEKLLPLL